MGRPDLRVIDQTSGSSPSKLGMIDFSVKSSRVEAISTKAPFIVGYEKGHPRFIFKVVFSVPLFAQCWVSSARLFLAPAVRSALAALWNWRYDERQSTWYEVAKLDLTHVSSRNERAKVGIPRSIVSFARVGPCCNCQREARRRRIQTECPVLVHLGQTSKGSADFRSWPGMFAFQDRGRRGCFPRGRASSLQLSGTYASYAVLRHNISLVRGATMRDWRCHHVHERPAQNLVPV